VFTVYGSWIHPCNELSDVFIECHRAPAGSFHNLHLFPSVKTIHRSHFSFRYAGFKYDGSKNVKFNSEVFQITNYELQRLTRTSSWRVLPYILLYSWRIFSRSISERLTIILVSVSVVVPTPYKARSY